MRTKAHQKALRNKAAYNRKPEVMHKRVLENKARRAALRAGRAHVGDSTSVDHIRALKDKGSGAPSNLRVVSARKNKGWRKGTSSYDPGRGRFNK